MRVDAAARQGPLTPAWAYFGYDEPNYTYTPDGSKLIAELAAASPVPVHIRAHHLLVTGDGVAALKWGSTNVYTEDAQGKPVYDFTIIDRIFDTYVGHGAKPFVELGFMPEALSVHPQPYMRHWRQPNDGDGWAYTTRDYRKWAGLIEALAPALRHPLWPGRGRLVVLGTLERARSGRLLEEHARRVQCAVRLHRRRREEGAARGARGRAGDHGPVEQGEVGRVPAAVSRALRPGKNAATGQRRRAARLRQLPRQGQP